MQYKKDTLFNALMSVTIFRPMDQWPKWGMNDKNTFNLTNLVSFRNKVFAFSMLKLLLLVFNHSIFT